MPWVKSELKRPWTTADLSVAMDLAKLGFTNGQIGERINRSPRAVGKVLVRWIKERRQPYRWVTREERRKEIARSLLQKVLSSPNHFLKDDEGVLGGDS